MNREDCIAVGSRLFAIFLLITLLRSFLPSMAALRAQHDTTAMAWSLAVLVLGLLICAALWRFPLTIARKLLPVMKEPRADHAMGASTALSVGLTLLGFWTLLTALPDASYWATIFLLTRHEASGYFAWGPEQLGGVVSTLLQLVLAVWMIFGSTGLQRLVTRGRYGRDADSA